MTLEMKMFLPSSSQSLLLSAWLLLLINLNHIQVVDGCHSAAKCCYTFGDIALYDDDAFGYFLEHGRKLKSKQFREYTKKCGRYEYKVYAANAFLKMFFYLEPLQTSKAIKRGCHPLVMHVQSKLPVNTKTMYKEILILDDGTDQVAPRAFKREYGRVMGVADLNNMRRAYRKASVNAAGQTKFRPLINDCADFHFNIAKELCLLPPQRVMDRMRETFLKHSSNTVAELLTNATPRRLGKIARIVGFDIAQAGLKKAIKRMLAWKLQRCLAVVANEGKCKKKKK